MTPKIFVIFSFVIIFLLVSYDQSRSFYEISEGSYVTVWKRLGGKCYIVFDKYYGVTKPSDWIRTTTSNSITILKNPSPEIDYAISNNYGESLVISSRKRIDYYDLSQRQIFVEKYYRNGKIVNGRGYLQIDIKEKYAVVNGIEQ